MLRTFVFALLVAVPTALITWLLTTGLQSDCNPANVQAKIAAPLLNSADPDQQMLALFTGLPAKFSLRTPPVLYDDKGLFDYIDGAAPIFIERNFRKLIAAEITTPDGGDLVCDVYDMKEQNNAASILTKERPTQAETFSVGDEGHRGRMFAVFRKGRYYTKFTSFNASGEKAILELAPLLAQKMP